MNVLENIKADAPQIDREKALAEVVSQIEQEYIELDKKAERLGLNQPVIVALSSISSTSDPFAQDWNDQVGYSSFNIKLPFPALKVKSLQLLSANIPQANANIPNTACVFWYYRFNGYTGQTPNADNLYCVRLLPSYYKPELLNDPTLYGYNQTFKNYKALNTELALSVAHDPAFDNYEFYSGTNIYQIPFLPNEISFSYNTNNRFSMTGTNAQTQYCYRLYNFEAIYDIGNLVYNDNFEVYKSLQNANENNTPATSPLFWKRVYLPIVQDWDSLVTYDANAIIAYNGNLYQASVRNTNQRPDSVFTWDSNYYYCKYQVVSYGGEFYTYIGIGPSFGAVPTNDAFWYPSTWIDGFTYPEGFIVFTDSGFYRAIQQSVGEQPANNDIYWEQMGSFWNEGADEISNRYLITGPSDPNVALRQGTELRQYNPYNLYEQGESVYHNGIKYTALLQNKGQVPFDATSATIYSPTTPYIIGDTVVSDVTFYICIQNNTGNYPSRLSSFWSRYVWDTTPEATILISGLSAISQTLDFYDRELDSTFPVGIPPQPFNPTPQRILNSILGFTFTGNFNAAAYSSIESGVVGDLVPSNLLNQYNRLRPVPTYFAEPALLQDHPSYVTQTYTADGYANLVYSSIIKIYCNLIFSGTIDSQNTNNLLGIIPLNCGNLGIAFANNYIDTKITKIQDEIYDINIRLEDEFGEPFVITNNAVSTLLLKLTYKETPA